MSTTTTYWLFDFDNTLHQADAGIFQLINQKMTSYLAHQLGMSTQEASLLRQDYWRRYGATLTGLQHHHPHIDIMDFLQQSHPIHELTPHLKPMDNVIPTLQQIPYHKAVFSNGPSFYIQALCQHMQIAPYFVQLFGTDSFDLLSKPHKQSYLSVCRQLHTKPNHCVMVDDSLMNLRMAKQLGMTTIWLYAGNEKHPFIDHMIPNFSSLIHLIQQDCF